MATFRVGPKTHPGVPPRPARCPPQPSTDASGAALSAAPEPEPAATPRSGPGRGLRHRAVQEPEAGGAGPGAASGSKRTGASLPARQAGRRRARYAYTWKEEGVSSRIRSTGSPRPTHR